MRKRVVKQIIVRCGKLRVVHSFRFYESVRFKADFGQKLSFAAIAFRPDLNHSTHERGLSPLFPY
jgi:hypothetical protein